MQKYQIFSKVHIFDFVQLVNQFENIQILKD